MAHGGGLHAASGSLDLLAFLTLGLLGSAAHCVGMCSPFVMIVARRYGVPEGRHSPLAAQLWYTAGRIITYAALGALAGALGGLVHVAGGLVGVQRAAALVAGAALVAWALVSLTGWTPRGTGARRLVRRRRRHLERPGARPSAGRRSVPRPAAVRSALFRGGRRRGARRAARRARRRWRRSALGTAPALLGVSLADTLLVRHRAAVNRLSQVFVLVMGVWFLWRGLRRRPRIARPAGGDATTRTGGPNRHKIVVSPRASAPHESGDMTSELWVLAFGAAVGGLVQGISGFAFAMVAMAIWVWGVDPSWRR